MMTAMPPAKLAEFAQQLTSNTGAFRSVGAAQQSTAQGYRTVTLPAQYERAKLNVMVVFDSEGKVAGLFFRPAA